MGRWRGQLVVAAALVASVDCFVGCLGGEPLGNHPTGSGGTGAQATGGGGDIGGTSTSGGGGSGPGQFCGEATVVEVAPPVPADILILLDRSSSMNDDSNEMVCTGGCGASSKWALLSAAIDSLVRQTPSANWGLAYYGSDQSCGVTAGAAVDVGPGTASAIDSSLAATSLGGDAPTAAAITAASAYLQSRVDMSARYILLATDGRSGCAPGDSGTADADAENAVASALSAGIPTFVVGIAPSSDTTATAVLNQMAVNGGEPSEGTPNSFLTIASLDPPFMQTMSLAVACAVPLSPAVGDATLAIDATMSDGNVVSIPQDPQNGWSFADATETSVELNGTACLESRNGTYTQIEVQYLCDLQAPREHFRPSAGP